MAASPVLEDRVLQAGGELPFALAPGFQRAFLIGAGVVLAAALIAFTATNTQTGRHTARHEPIMNAIPGDV